MTCKDCIHCEACERMISDTSKMFKVLLSEILKMNCDIKYDSTNILSGAEICQCFQARSRFVELPCKVGDTVYAYWDMDNPCSNYLHVIEDFIIDVVILVDRKNSVIGFRAGRTCEQNGRKCDIEFDLKDIGKTVFLTREEAEQALKERENNDKTDH